MTISGRFFLNVDSWFKLLFVKMSSLFLQFLGCWCIAKCVDWFRGLLYLCLCFWYDWFWLFLSDWSWLLDWFWLFLRSER